MADNTFFDETTEQSAIKAAIVADYFWAWAKIIGRTVKGHGDMVAYIDLFAGPGSYKDGSASTPLLVLQKAIGDQELSQMLVSIFNDRDALKAQSVIMADDQVDALKDQVLRELLTYMIADPHTIERSLALILISRHLERIGDHATNIAEDVIYVIQGRDVRHPKTPKKRPPEMET